MFTAFSKWLADNLTVAASLCLGAGIVTARLSGPSDERASLIILLIVLVSMVVCFRWGGAVPAMALCIMFVTLGFRLATVQLLWGNGFEPTAIQQVINATVSETLGSGKGFRILLVEGGTVDGGRTMLPGYGRIFLRDNSLPLCAGDRIAFRARLRKPINRGNPGEYNWGIHCRNEHIGWQCSMKGDQSVLLVRRGNRFAPEAVLFRVRQSMNRFLELFAGRIFHEDSRREVRAILKGIVLGDRGEIDHPLSMSFARSGLAHMLSASGLHVGIVVLLVSMTVKGVSFLAPGMLLRVPFPRLLAIASIPAMIVYCLLVGSRVPAMRATIMGTVFAVAILLDRRWNSFNSLALAAIFLLLFYPLSLFTPGFQLSFVAVAGILMVADTVTKRLLSQRSIANRDESTEGRPLHRYFRERTFATFARWTFGMTLTSIAATLAVTPLLLEIFHMFPAYTVLANLLAGFLLTLGLCLGLVATSVGAVWPWLGSVLILPADITIRLIIDIAKFFEGLPGSTIHIARISPWELGLAGAVSFGALSLIKKPSRATSYFLCASLAALVAVSGILYHHRSSAANLSMVFLNVGNGDSIFLKPPGSKGLLVDGGIRTPYFDTGVSVLIPFLNRMGARELDGMVMTHPQMDHMGGLLSVLDEIPTKCFWWNPVKVVNPHFDLIMASHRTKKVLLFPAVRGDPPIQMGRAQLRFLNRPGITQENGGSSRGLNDASVVFRVDYGAVSALFTGDLERDGEEELLQSGVPLQATILKVGHHGGRTSSTDGFLRAIRPKIAIISADYPSSGGRPRQEVIDRLKSIGAKVYWTGRDGALTVSTDGRRTISVTLGKKGQTTVLDLTGDQDFGTNLK